MRRAALLDQDAADPVFRQIPETSLEHDRLVEKNETDWLAAASRAGSRIDVDHVE